MYTMRVNGRYIDAIGASDIPVSMGYIPPFLGLGSPSKEKYLLRHSRRRQQLYGRATVDIIDTDGALAENIPTGGHKLMLNLNSLRADLGIQAKDLWRRVGLSLGTGRSWLRDMGFGSGMG